VTLPKLSSSLVAQVGGRPVNLSSLLSGRSFHGSAVGSAAMRRAHDRRMRAWFAFFAELVAPLGVADAEATGMAVALFVEGMAVHVAMMQRPRPAAWQRAFARTQVERLVSPTTPS
jgi:hypothetical protein